MRFVAAFARDAIVALAVLTSTPAPARAEAPATLTFPALLARFAAMPGLEARFREERRIALLAAPLVSEGVLLFSPPGSLLRRITTPAPQTVLIRDGQLTYSDGDRTGRLDLGANPTVRQVVESFGYLLAGDEAALRRLYDVRFALRPGAGAGPGMEAWEVALTPRPPALRRVLREVRLRGAGVALEEMRVLETTGDETWTTFTAVDAARRYSPAERARVFSLPAPPAPRPGP
jgi:hypothetical protein